MSRLVEYPKAVLQPPEKIDTPYHQAISGHLWVYDDIPPHRIMAGEWPIKYCSHDECSVLTGVSERALLVLQTAGAIRATKAPLDGGSFKRVWHLPEVAAAATIECLKQAMNIDYIAAAKISLPVAEISRQAFVEFVKMKNDGIENQFGANLILSEGRYIFLLISDALRAIAPDLRRISVGNTFNAVPVATLKDGEISPAEVNGQKIWFANAVENARFEVAVKLRSVFRQFEQQAKALRKT